MKEDFLDELGHLGLIARLKRLSDSMLYSIREVYKQEGLDIEPNWHLVFLILKKNKTMAMTEIADAFHLSQPAIVKVINKMEQRGYVNIIKDAKDNRRRLLTLSDKAKRLLPGYEKIWSGGEKSIQQMLEGNEAFTDILTSLENQLEQQSFEERILKNRKS